MHEMSIAMSLVELACEEASRRHLGRVQALHVRIGTLSGVATEALLFSFDVAASGTPIEGATLNVEDTPGSELELFALEVPA
jgi:hydrogenase nickel incorporation protein HypA/HybF